MTRVSEVTIDLPAGSWKNEDIAASANISPEKMAQRAFAEYAVPISELRVWDNVATLLPATAATDDLGVVTGTPTVAFPVVSTGDVKALGSITRKASFFFPVPPNYDDGQTVQCRIRARMQTNVADTSATLDLQAFVSDGDGGISADLYSGAAVSINSLAAANYDFDLTPTLIDPGSLIVCIITIVTHDVATVGAVTAAISDIRLRVDTRG